jgi:mxaK protein
VGDGVKRTGPIVGWSGAALGVLLVLAGIDLYRWHGLGRWNAWIGAVTTADAARMVQALEADAPAEARLALAWAVAQRGETTRAVALYREVAQARPDLACTALYNAANALAREGERVIASGDWVGARPLLELAKETYREALRLDPGRWDVRYNLERALRIAPETGEAAEEPLPAGGESERSVTTMRAFTLGLP